LRNPLIHVPLTGPFCALLCTVVAALPLAAQPVETGAFRAPDLVEIVRLDSSVHLDIRYATADNFMKRRMYAGARAFLQRPAAEALLRVHRALRARGLGILVKDAYRPWSVTKQFWDETPPGLRRFVADPAKGSRHNRGCAVDCTLYRLKRGEEVSMPSPYDEFSARASPRYEGGTSAERRMRELLRASMKAEGFTVDPGEWWHFDYRGWRSYRVLDIPFGAVR
jgi:D-alanyl-D-alanine dipeptidase